MAQLSTDRPPTVDLVQRRAAWCRRWPATLLVFLVAFIVRGGLIARFAVPLAHEATGLADRLPGLADDVQGGCGPIGELVERYYVRQYIAGHRDQLQGYARRPRRPGRSPSCAVPPPRSSATRSRTRRTTSRMR